MRNKLVLAMVSHGRLEDTASQIDAVVAQG